MCGITGFIGKGTKSDLVKMVAAIEHRGPDAQGHFWSEGVALGHTRLSIIDLSETGAQPMFDNNKEIGVVFNGEIYNFPELRKELEVLGYVFRGTSDTEAIIYLYKEYGEKCFERMNGMFAIAIYDFKNKKLILARDRMGKKPLYWALFEKTLIFGSELKSLIPHPLFKKELDLNSVNKYLQYDYVPSPHSIFKNVYKLEPASCLVFENGKINKNIFWGADLTPKDISLNEALEELDSNINSSVISRLVADVPLGIFLSGGLDSSAIAYYAQKNSKDKIKTFSIGFREDSFDESKYARQVAEYLGTDHYEKILSAKDSLSMIPKIADILDEPVADASIIPTYLLSKFTKEKVTVALGGDGGDELFAGYPTFQADSLVGLYEGIPEIVRKEMIEKIIKSIPASEKNFSLGFKLKKFISGLGVNKKYLHQTWLGSFGREDRGQLFKERVWKNLSSENEFEDIDRYLDEVKDGDHRNKTLYLYMRTYLMDQVLVKVDRASMSSAMEVRAPFLDISIVEFANSLPYRYKYRNFQTKYILKKLMTGKLPKNIIHRSKKGFGIPLGKWLKEDLKDFCNKTLSRENSDKFGLFNYEYINKIKNEHFSGRKDNRKLLWNLMVLFLWREKWF
ncbi:MAG TPA: asparagine synthase (glutamine-hydrolyzing) [Candidatus Paceibacterota bacterium]|nr:asparagine synthase (glutamine-hydrolyzing) [Candidatus Paceibacterota bacterium]